MRFFGKTLRNAVGILAMTLFLIAGAAAQPPLLLTESHASIQTLSPVELDFQNFRNTVWLFTLDFRFASPSAAAIDARLHAKLDFSLADGRRFENAVVFTTMPFEVPPAGRTVTNLDMGPNTPIPTDEYNYDRNARDAVEEVALATQQIPAGRYTIDLVAVNATTREPISNAVTIEFVLQDFSRLTMIWPPDGAEVPEYSTLQWLTDAPRVRLRVGEIGEGMSREEAISREPLHVDAILEGQSSFELVVGPNVRRQFQTGMRYAWTVEVLRRASGGLEVPTRGQIWELSLTSGTATAISSATLLRQIAQFLEGDFQSIADQIDRENLAPTGSVWIGGTAVTQAEIVQLLNYLMQYRSNILGVTLE
jgi:hypothetical protein